MELRGDDNLTDEKKASRSRNTHLSERLKKERSKALEVLQARADKVPKESSEKKNKENVCEKNKMPYANSLVSKTTGETTTKTQLGTLRALEKSSKKTTTELKNSTNTGCLDNQTQKTSTEFVPYNRHREPIDISALITDESITLETSAFNSLRDTDVSFHPGEMTGRSTLQQRDSKLARKPVKCSVDQILADSFVDHVRERCNSNILYNASISSFIPKSIDSSCISGFSDMQKNPRLTSNESKRISSHSSSLRFSIQENQMNEESCYGDASFAPGEIMRSMLIRDEISWAKEHAVIPTAVLSEEARRALTVSANTSQLSTLNSTSFNDTNFSMGHFFAKRSDDLASIIEKENEEKHYDPIALIGDTTAATITSTTEHNSPEKAIQTYEVLTPKINSTGEGEGGNTITLTTTTRLASLISDTHDSKDSGNATEKSDLLRLSNIDRILYNLDIAAGDVSVPKSNKEATTFSIMDPHISGIGEADLNLNKGGNNLKEITNILMENKENIQLYENCSNDTLSFTESLLNTSIQNYRLSNAGQARSPLSPIPIMITESIENDGDIDEFSNSPIVTPMRRKRYTKSPRRSPVSTTIPASTEDTTEIITEQQQHNLPEKPKIMSVENVNIAVTQSSSPSVPATVVKNKKSLCSTRLDGDQNSPIGSSCADISSNFSKNATCNGGALTPTFNGVNTYELSPLSSPCSYLSSLAASPLNNVPTNSDSNNIASSDSSLSKRSSKNSCWSSQWDNTKNPDTQYLQTMPSYSKDGGFLAPGRLRRVASSPSHSEASTTIENKCNNFSVPPVRTYSTNSVKSCDGDGTSSSTRASSRCSNNSEFSHRDGKVIPIKVTALELSWPSVKLRTDSQKSLQVKNTSNKRLMLRIDISGPGFQLINPDSNMLTLQSQECRTIVVNFNPTMIGPAIGRLMFQPPRSLNCSSISSSNNGNNEVSIPLYAYGGHASITIQNLLRGPVGAPFIPMGEFCTLIRPLERTFQIYNKGPLLGFAAICVEPIGLHLPETAKALRVHPECALIQPRSAVTISLILELNHNDMRKIRKIIEDVMTLAKLRIIYGDEAIRQRLRQTQRSMRKGDRENIFPRSLDKLWERFPGEKALFPSGLFKDSASSVAQDMWACISEQEVALTLNNNMLDETAAAELSTIFTEADSTVLFRTVCVSSPTNTNPELETVDEILEETTTHHPHPLFNQLNESTSPKQVAIHPELIELKMDEHDDEQKLTVQPTILRVRNYSNTRKYFNIVCNHRDLLRFVPHDGYIEANGAELSIEMKLCSSDAAMKNNIPNDITISLYMDNKKMTIPVHLVPSSHSSKSS